jgi:hypothetical protein
MKWYMFKLKMRIIWTQYSVWRWDLPHDPFLDTIYICIMGRRKVEKDCLDAVKLYQKWGHRTVSSHN